MGQCERTGCSAPPRLRVFCSWTRNLSGAQSARNGFARLSAVAASSYLPSKLRATENERATMKISSFLDRLESVRRCGSGWTALCPAHDDRRPSLSIAEGADGRILVFCFAGCSLQEIVRALGLRVHDLFPNSSRPRREWRAALAARRQENLKKRREELRQGLLLDAIREARRLIEAAGGLDVSGWSDDRLDRELNRLADAYKILEVETAYE